MAILFYTTSVAASRTAAELISMLSGAGAHKVMLDNDGAREPVAITFAVPVGPEQQLLYFTLPCNWPGVLKAMQKQQLGAKYCHEAQARRVAWRIIKSWCEAQMAIIEAGQAQLAEVFLPYAQTPDGDTLFKSLESGSFKALGQ